MTGLQAQQFYLAVRLFGPKWTMEISVSGARKRRGKPIRASAAAQAPLQIDELALVLDAALGERTPGAAAGVASAVRTRPAPMSSADTARLRRVKANRGRGAGAQRANRRVYGNGRPVARVALQTHLLGGRGAQATGIHMLHILLGFDLGFDLPLWGSATNRELIETRNTLVSLSPRYLAAGASVPGLLLLLLWWRGRLALDDPYCRKCGQILRRFDGPPTTCPECGASLRGVGAVRFARRVRRHWLAACAFVLLLCAPVAAPAARTALINRAKWELLASQQRSLASEAPTPAPSAAQRIATLVDAQQAAGPSSPFDNWDRVEADAPEAAATSDGLDQLLVQLERLLPPDRGIDQRREQRSGGAVVEAIGGSQLADAEQLLRFARLWYGPIPLSVTPRVGFGGRPRIVFEPIDSSDWGSIDGDAMAMLRLVRLDSVRLVGGTLGALAPEERGFLLAAMQPGEHVIEADVQWLVLFGSVASLQEISVAVERGGVLLPGASLPPSLAALFAETTALPDPTSARIRRLAFVKETLRRKLRVASAGDSMVDPVSEPTERAEFSRAIGTLRIQSATIRPIGGPGEVTLVADLVTGPGRRNGPGRLRMLGQLVADVGDATVRGSPQVITINTSRNQTLQTVIRLESTMPLPNRSVGKATFRLEPVAVVDGTAISFTTAWTEAIPLGTHELRRADLGE